MSGNEIDRVLEKLARDVESAVHALYRGEVRQGTAKVRTDGFVRAAADAVRQAGATTPAGGPGAAPMQSPRPSVAAPMIAGSAAGLVREEGEAVLKCITAWLPTGPPATTDPASKCISAMRELTPTWAQREKALAAVRRISQP